MLTENARMCILLISTDITIFLVIEQFLAHQVFLKIKGFSEKTQTRKLYRNIYLLLLLLFVVVLEDYLEPSKKFLRTDMTEFNFKAAQKMKFSIKDFFSKYEQIRRFTKFTGKHLAKVSFLIKLQTSGV